MVGSARGTSMTDLTSELRRCFGSSLGRRRLRRALAHPWCWPAQDELERAALGAGFSRPATRVGTALLVAVSADEREAGLWCLERRTEGRQEERGAFGSVALDALRLAERLVTRHLPILCKAPRLPTGTWRPVAIFEEGGAASASHLVDGASYGASMLIACASIHLGRAPAADLAVSAQLSASGGLFPVGGICRKVELVDRSALGVTRLMVSSEQKDEALRAKPQRVQIVPVKNAQELIEQAFPGTENPSYLDASEARDAARRLFRIALVNESPLLAWDCVARSAEAALRLVHGEEFVTEQLEFARNVALRHESKPSALQWPAPQKLATFARPLRYSYLAHVVQDLTDGGHPDLSTRIAELRGNPELVRPIRECGEEDLRLRGALGRGLARLRRWTEAADLLDETVRAWFAIYKGGFCSYALSELTRVQGIRAGLDEVHARVIEETVLPWYAEARSEPEFNFLSEAYVRLALARALTTAGSCGLALELLDPATFEWAALNEELGTSHQRWRARALRAAGKSVEADGVLEALQTEHGASDQSALAALDRALALGGDLERALETVFANEQAARTLRGSLGEFRALPLPERARRVANEYAY